MKFRAAYDTFFKATVALLFIVAFGPPALAQSARKISASAQAMASSASSPAVGRPATAAAIRGGPPTPARLIAADRYGMSPGQRRAWLMLGIAQHGAAFFDAKTTRDAMRNHQELDPLLRPFAHSAALYPVMQVAPTGLDWLAVRLAASRHRWLRRIWWLPQAAATAGFLWSATHNLSLPDTVPR